ncbi:methyl-accepting chemotaxis protein, partial [Litchfieldella xinjiangensis]|uniref:methyl-accepting chemotaxis protein n=1 Tax=Litchfieldella xinjiangensis TaxID=1166948 RepID=UPI0005BD208C
MRNNQPVTQREYSLADHDFLITRTDLKGRITYANPAFVKVSGYEHEELIGASHNLVRHPDMPEVAFQNLWETLKAGETWTGLVKNRRKDGDHYWVNATVTPIIEGGEVLGYASVRIKAEREAIEEADKAYRALSEGKARHLQLNRGRLQRRGLVGLMGRVNMRTQRARLVSMIAVSAVLLMASGGLGLYGLQESGERLQTLSRDGLEDVARLLQIDQGVTQSHQRLSTGSHMDLMEGREEEGARLSAVVSNLDTIWQGFAQREVNRTVSASTLGDALAQFRQEHAQPMATALTGEEPFEAYQALKVNLAPMQAAGAGITAAVNALVTEKLEHAQALATQARDRRQQIMVAQGALLLGGLMLLILMGTLTLRALMKPLRESMHFTLQIAAGNLAASMPSHRNDEAGQLMRALDVMRKSLGSIVGNVNSGVAVVTPAARDISQGNEDLSSRTEQQAASLQETASSMEEMTATVRQNADNARQASGLAVDNASRVQATGELMNDVVSTMGRITESSRKMTDIINVIDSIAFQT